MEKKKKEKRKKKVKRKHESESGDHMRSTEAIGWITAVLMLRERKTKLPKLLQQVDGYRVEWGLRMCTLHIRARTVKSIP